MAMSGGAMMRSGGSRVLGRLDEHKLVEAAQALQRTEREQNELALEAGTLSRCLTFQRPFELESLLTGARLWVTTDPIGGRSGRVMADAPPFQCRTTRWMCLGRGAGEPVRYQDEVYLWNPAPEVSLHLNARGLDRDVVVEAPEPGGSLDNGWRRFRLVHPEDLGRSATRKGLIHDGDPVILEARFSETDPVRYLRVIKHSGRYWLGRWERTRPEAHVLRVRLPQDGLALSGPTRRLMPGSFVRLVSVSTGKPLGVRRDAKGTWVSVEPGAAERWCVQSSKDVHDALSTGDTVSLFNPELGYHAPLNGRAIDRWCELTWDVAGSGYRLDDWRRLRLLRLEDLDRPVGARSPASMLHDGDVVALELCSLAQMGKEDPVRFLRVERHSDGLDWLVRDKPSARRDEHAFRIEVLDAALSAHLREDLSYRQEKARNAAWSAAREVERMEQDSARPRQAASAELGAEADGLLVCPGSEAFARLAPRAALTVQVRACPRHLHFYNVLVAKGAWDPCSYRLGVLVDGAVQLLFHEAETGAVWGLTSPPGAMQAGRWSDVGAVIDLERRRLALYVDGKRVAEREASAPLPLREGRQFAARLRGLVPSPQKPLYIGIAPDDAPEPHGWDGWIDEVRVWDVARDEAELRDERRTRLRGPKPGLCGAWVFEDMAEYGWVPDRSGANLFALDRRRASLALVGAHRGAIVSPREARSSSDFERLTPQRALTLEAWVRLDPAVVPEGHWQWVVGKGPWEARSYGLGVSHEGQLHLALHDASGRLLLTLYSPPGLVRRGRWHHVAGVVDPERDMARLLVDGRMHADPRISQLLGTRPGDFAALCASPTHPLIMGQGPIEHAPEWRLHGWLADVRVWSLARSDEEIRADLYNRNLHGREGLVGWWPFEKIREDGQVEDLGGGGNPVRIRAGAPR
jgi:hypothetical protein